MAALTRRQLDEKIKKEKEEKAAVSNRKTRAELDLIIAEEKWAKQEKAEKAAEEAAKKEAKPKQLSRAELDKKIAAKKEKAYRAQLEQEMEQAKAEQQSAQDRIDFAEAPLATQLGLSSAQVGDNIMDTAVTMALDLPSSVPNVLLGTDVDLRESAGLGWVGEQDYVPQGTVSRAATDFASTTLEFLGGVTPVARNAAGIGSNVAEVLGVGTTIDDDVADLARRSVDAIPEMHRIAPDISLQTVDWNNETMVGEVIERANAETVAINLSDEMATVDKLEGDLAKVMRETEQAVIDKKMTEEAAENKVAGATKKRDAALKEMDETIKPAERAAAHDFGVEHAESVIKTIARRYDMTIVEATEIVNNNGGVTPVGSFSELRQMRAAQKANELYTTTGVSATKGDTKIFGRAGRWSYMATLVRPTTALIRENVGKGAAAQMERALLRAEKNKSQMQMKYEGRTAEFNELVNWAGTREVKQLFMDLKTTGSDGRYELVTKARRELNADAFNTFLDMIQDSDRHQRSMLERVWSGEEKLDQVYWGIDGRRTDPKNKTVATRNFEDNKEARRPDVVTQVAERDRGVAANMDEAELDAYDNPILSQYRRLTEDQDLLALAETFDMPTGMRIGDGIQDFAKALGNQTFAATGDINKSTAMETLSSSILTGSRKRPNKWVQRYMTQSYAGTLGQFDSALLNIHDVAISAWRNGALNTGKAILKKAVFDGVNPRDFGVGDAHVAEFREGMSKLLDNPEKLDTMLQKYSDVAFSASLFKHMDMYGKGVVMGSALEQMRTLAKKGDNLKALHAKYGHLMSTREMAEISSALKKGTDIADMSPRVRDIIGDAMLGKLAEQQLMTMASRPLAYLNHPGWRPLWAMAGFAIKQGDILKTEILDNIALGNYAKAGEQSALWAVWGIAGYAVFDTMRDLPSYALSVMGGGEPKEAKAPGAIGNRLAEGFLGPVTINRAGDMHTMGQMSERPIETLQENVLNPVSTGLLGILMRAGVSVFDPEVSTLGILSEGVPSIGRYMSTYMKSKHQADRKEEKMWEIDYDDWEDDSESYLD